MPISKTFALGCFHFAAEDQNTPPETFLRKSTYPDAISAILKSVDSISNISVNVGTSFLMLPIEPDPQEDGVNGPFFPCPASGKISFEAFIPYRIQESVFRGICIENCERFYVEIFYDYEFPVTVISPCDERFVPSEEGFSRSVPIVREFLALKCSTSDGIRFVSMGPSPFHAEFLVSASDNDTDSVRINRTLGYDDIYVYSKDIANFSKSKLLDSILRVASHYYDSVYIRNSISDRETYASSSIINVLQRLTERNIWNRFKNGIFHSNKRDIASAYLSLIELDNLIQEHVKHTSNQISRLHSDVSDNPLWLYVDEENEKLKPNTLSGLENILKLSQTFENSSATNYTAIVAAIISAVITFAATIMTITLQK